MSIPHDDLSRYPVRPSRVLAEWNSPTKLRAQAAQRSRYAAQARTYEGAATNRLTNDWNAGQASGDSELFTSLRIMRARSRELVRDNPFAAHALRILRNNVVGEGIGMQAQVKTAGGKLQTKINDSIEAAYSAWSDRKTCHVAGLLSMADIEHVAMSQLVTAGEVIIRKLRQPFGGGTIPLALEVIESDRLLDNYQTGRAPNGNIIRMGVEIDQWHRPVAYWLNPNHPGDYQFATFDPSRFMRVPAEDIIHLYVINRWPQTRGEPWFHATLRSMRDEGGLADAEIVKARASANIVGFIRSPEPLVQDATSAGRRLLDTEPGTWQQLLPGEDVAGMSTYAANPSLDPFLRYMVRKMALGVGLSYGAFSGDRTASTYSSERISMLDDRDSYRVLQGFFIRNLRSDLHREFMDAATLVGAIKTGADYYTNPTKYQAVRFKPRGWSWIDPVKEVEAYKTAVRCGFMTQGDVIDQTSRNADFEDVIQTRKGELNAIKEAGLAFDTNPLQVNDKGAAQPGQVASANAPTTATPGETPAAEPGKEGPASPEPGDPTDP